MALWCNGGSPRTLRKLYKKDTTLDCALCLESFDYSSLSSILEILNKLMILRTILAIIRINTVKRIKVILGIS